MISKALSFTRHAAAEGLAAKGTVIDASIVGRAIKACEDVLR